MKILITGSDGLIGGEAVSHFDSMGHEVYGADNNMRRKFFGADGDTSWNRHRIFHNCKNYHPNDTDITNPLDVWSLFHRGNGRDIPYTLFKYDVIIHCAAQPSHDYAAKNPELDYQVNVEGTRNLLECSRKFNPEAVFIFMSTNKVYDDAVNQAAFYEYETRFDVDPWSGFDEATKTGASNVFGSHKLEADELVQKYAKDFNMKTIVLRGGCLTGPNHSGVEMHGFLSYLVKCAVSNTSYKIYGYKGKQVRDNVHSYDVVRAFEAIIQNPRSGSVYNIGGGRQNSVSILEAIDKLEKKLNKKITMEYTDQARCGDHICYITDMSKFRHDYPSWKITKSIDTILDEMIQRDYWDDHTEDKHTLDYPLNQDSIVIDIGGYRGTWTADIIDKYNPIVLLFEPTKEFSKVCQERFKDNPKVRVIKTALGDTIGTILLARQGMNTSAYRGNPGQTELPPDRILGEAKPEEVSITDIHNEIEQIGEVDLISCNCEGGEYKIIQRLIDTGDIKKIKNLQVQFHSFYPNAGAERDKLRILLGLTHVETFCYPFVWESWRLR